MFLLLYRPIKICTWTFAHSCWMMVFIYLTLAMARQKDKHWEVVLKLESPIYVLWTCKSCQALVFQWTGKQVSKGAKRLQWLQWNCQDADVKLAKMAKMGQNQGVWGYFQPSYLANHCTISLESNIDITLFFVHFWNLKWSWAQGCSKQK